VIPYGRQSINQKDIDAVVDVLKSDFLTQGPKVYEFEQNLANYCNAKYVTAVSNGTAALHLAYLAIGIKEGDIVWTVPNTFVATANSALHCGAIVDFVDIDSKTYNISIDSLKNKLFFAKKKNKLPKLVVPVHFAGQSCEMKEIWSLSKEYGFRVIEDASHSLGGEYKGNKIGCCQYSDMAVFSFHPVKMITTGEGGVVTTNSSSLNKRILLLRSHGITKNKSDFKNIDAGSWYYEQHELGFNYRLTDIQAALGISQLSRLDNFVKKRQIIAKKYCEELKNVILPYQRHDTKSSWHLFVIKVKDRDKIYEHLKKKGVMSQVHYIPVNIQPFYNAKDLVVPNSASYYEQCLSLPIFPDLKISDQNKVIEAL